MKIKLLLCVFLFTLACKSEEVVDTYELRMIVDTPRIYNNTQSMGYRKYQNQRLKGIFEVHWLEDDSRYFKVKNLENLTYKINGSNITYNVIVDNDGEICYPRFNYIGNNATGVFKTPSIIWYMDCDPSYNIGDDEPDNSLLIQLSGRGNAATKTDYCGKYIVAKYLRGTLSGTLGCGCKAYGHKSPTRVAGCRGPICNKVDDVATVDGRWYLRWKNRTIICR